MNIDEKIIQYIHELPESKKAEVLDFVEYLATRVEEKEWSQFSLSAAMTGMENEESVYSAEDLKESFS